MTEELINFNEKLIEDLKKLNLEYEKLGFKPPFVFIDENPYFLNYDENPQMKKPYVYSSRGIQRLKNLAGQSLENEHDKKGETNE